MFISAIVSTAAMFCLPNRLSACSIFCFLVPSSYCLSNNDKHQERVTCTAAPGQLLLQVWLSRTCQAEIQAQSYTTAPALQFTLATSSQCIAKRSGCKFQLLSEMELMSQEVRCGMVPYASWSARSVRGPPSQTQSQFF